MIGRVLTDRPSLERVEETMDFDGPSLSPMRTIAFAVLSFATGCGLGPFNPVGANESPIEDVEPLTVVSVSPASGATGVAVDAVVSATFSRPLDPATLDASTVRLLRNDPDGDVAVPGAIALTQGGATLVVEPDGGLANHAAYTVELTSGIRGVQPGEPTFSGTSFGFSTTLAAVAVDDAENDTFPTGPFGRRAPDLTSVSAEQGDEAITIVLEFARSVDPRPDAVDAVAGFVDLDVDQDGSTGNRVGTVDDRRIDGRLTGLGVEFVVVLALDGTAGIVDAATGEEIASIDVVFQSRRITLTVPYSVIGDPRGNVDFAAIVGTRFDPTDVAPNEDAIALGVEPPRSRG